MFAPLRPPSASPNSLDPGLQVHLQNCLITAWECISQFNRLHCGETEELKSRQPIINTLPHLVWHQKGIHGKEPFYLEKRKKRVRWYEGIPSHDDPHKLRGCKKLGKSAWNQELGKIECVLHMMSWCVSTPGSLNYILPVAESISDIPVSPSVYI